MIITSRNINKFDEKEIHMLFSTRINIATVLSGMISDLKLNLPCFTCVSIFYQFSFINVDYLVNSQYTVKLLLLFLIIGLPSNQRYSEFIIF